MKYITFLIVPVIVSWFLVLAKREDSNNKDGYVHMPVLFLILGIITSMFFLVISIIAAFANAPAWCVLLFFAFSLLGDTFVIAYANCKIFYDEDGFVAKNFFGIKRKYTYEQVESLKENMHEKYLYVGKRRIMVDEFAVGGSNFIAYVKKRYRNIHKGESLPKFQNNKSDLFKGNVRGAGDFIVIYSLLGVIVLFFSGIIVWWVFFQNATIDNTIEKYVAFESFELIEKEAVLTSTDDEIYKIGILGDGIRLEEIEAVCDGSTVVTTYVCEITPDDAEPYYSIEAFCKDGTYLISFDDSNRWHRQNNWPLIFLPIGVALLFGSYIGGSIIVGRNPRKYGKKIVRLFFKDGYIKY